MVKHEHGKYDAAPTEIPTTTSEGDGEQADFEIDEVLRGLALDKWFATAEADVPIWVF